MLKAQSRKEITVRIQNAARLGLRIKHDKMNISFMTRRIERLGKRVAILEEQKKEQEQVANSYCDDLLAKELNGNEKAKRRYTNVKIMIANGGDIFKKENAKIDRMPRLYVDSDKEMRESAVPKTLLKKVCMSEGEEDAEKEKSAMEMELGDASSTGNEEEEEDDAAGVAEPIVVAEKISTKKASDKDSAE
jgi:hypothetical protein